MKNIQAFKVMGVTTVIIACIRQVATLQLHNMGMSYDRHFVLAAIGRWSGASFTVFIIFFSWNQVSYNCGIEFCNQTN